MGRKGGNTKESIAEFALLDGEKKCRMCLRVLPIKNYTLCKTSHDGFDGCCRACKAEKAKKWREANGTRAMATVRRWQSANPELTRKYYRRSYLKKKYNLDVGEYETMH